MKIICIGRNYKSHVQELNHEMPTEPVFFMKPDSALLIRNRPFYIPEWSQQIDYETELILKICKTGKYIEERFAHTYYDEIGIGIDFTARDLQQKCIAKGNPWEICKSFDFSAPLGNFVKKETLNLKEGIHFQMTLNGEIRQQGNSNDMIFSFDKIISYLSQFMMIKTGDLIFTGTPSGIGTVSIGDRIECFIEGVSLLRFTIK